MGIVMEKDHFSASKPDCFSEVTSCGAHITKNYLQTAVDVSIDIEVLAVNIYKSIYRKCVLHG
jgi:hypothetical protein